MNWTRLAKRRSFLVLLFFSFCWVLLLGRLVWIQITSVHHFSRHQIDLVQNAVKQRQQTIVLNNGRGDILDRNGDTLTGEEQNALVLFPLARGEVQGTEGLKRVARIVGRPETELASLLEKGKQPIILRDAAGKVAPLSDGQADAINRLQLPGIAALRVSERYRQDEIARQVIGYVHQNPELLKRVYPQELESGRMSIDNALGAAGIERSFDRFLQGLSPSTLSYYVDAAGHPLRGLDMRYQGQENHFYPLSVQTTLDRAIQRKMEQVADQSGLHEGAIVVLDTKTADILAMVSRPQFDPAHLSPTDTSWQNHALKQLAPGSVFKTVVAAAALREGLVSPTERFTCEGHYGRFGFSCWKKEGHGSLTLEEAFAESCNIAFAQIANRVGGEKLEEYARSFGIGSPVGHVTAELFKLKDFRQLAGEEPGSIFSADAHPEDEGTLIQTAIGQRDVRMTPLAAANMMVTIANGGKAYQPRLVSKILYRNGTPFYQFATQQLTGAGIDGVTAFKIKRMMGKVVEEGTGQLLTRAAWPVAGKSGTAQTTKNGEPRNHQWFVGYAPADQPRYAIAVVAENRRNGSSHLATSLFKEVVDSLASLDRTRLPGETAARNLPE